jgi:K+-sensing histidine kinase KdpD
VEVINKTDEIYSEYCAPQWFHLQDYIKMHGQQNINLIFPLSILVIIPQNSGFEPSSLISFLPVTTINTFFHTPLYLISC